VGYRELEIEIWEEDVMAEVSRPVVRVKGSLSSVNGGEVSQSTV
jgi:hypothetical protein